MSPSAAVLSTMATQALLAKAPASSRTVPRVALRAPSVCIQSIVSRRQVGLRRGAVVAAAADKDSSEGEEPEELPPWVRREREKKAAEATGDLPFGVYLLLSSIVAIAAVGSIFEFANKNPLFGVIQPDSPLWAPILLLFAITGLPSAGVLFVKAINAANAAAEAMDNVDGY